MAYTARRGTLRCIIIGVISETASGEAENKTALIEEVTYCSPQTSSAYGTAMMFAISIMIAFHSLASAGQGLSATMPFPAAVLQQPKSARPPLQTEAHHGLLPESP